MLSEAELLKILESKSASSGMALNNADNIEYFMEEFLR